MLKCLILRKKATHRFRNRYDTLGYYSIQRIWCERIIIIIIINNIDKARCQKFKKGGMGIMRQMDIKLNVQMKGDRSRDRTSVFIEDTRN